MFFYINLWDEIFKIYERICWAVNFSLHNSRQHFGNHSVQIQKGFVSIVCSRFFFLFISYLLGFVVRVAWLGPEACACGKLKSCFLIKKKDAWLGNQNHFSSIMHSLLSISPLFPHPSGLFSFDRVLQQRKGAYGIWFY